MNRRPGSCASDVEAPGRRSVLGQGCPALVVLNGPAGSGRTRALADVHRDLVAAGRRAYPLRFYPDGALSPASIPLRPTGGTVAGWGEIPLGPRTGAAVDPDRARQVAGAAAVTLAARDGVLLVDDAQWADPDAIAVLDALLRQLPGPGVRCVLAFRTPGGASMRSAGRRLFDTLRQEGRAIAVSMSSLRPDEVARAIRHEVDAVPSPELLTLVRVRSRHVRAAVHDVVASLVADGAVQVVDRHAYAVHSSRDETAQQQHLVGSLRRLGPDALAAARAVAVLHPLGPAAATLVAEALECDPHRAIEHLTELHEAGFLHRGRHGSSWRFLVPALAEALRAEAGPFERRRLAAMAVDAVWAGRAPCDDKGFLTERIAEAGTLVPLGLARLALITEATRATGVSARDARRWWRAAAEIAEDRTQWAMASLQECAACYRGADYGDCLERLHAVLDEAADHLPVEALHQALHMQLAALHYLGDIDAVEAAAAGDDTGGRHQDGAVVVVRRALALALLDRWPEARGLLERTQHEEVGSTLTAGVVELLEACANLYCGRPEAFEKRLASGRIAGRGSSMGGPPGVGVDPLASALLTLGDVRRCERLLIDEKLPETKLCASSRATLDLLRGRPGHSGDVLDSARGALAVGMVHGNDLGHALLCQTVGSLLAAQGRLTVARDLVERARARRPNRLYLLDLAEARIDMAFDDRERAEERLLTGLTRAREHEIVAGTDAFHALLALARLGDGDPDTARRHLADLQHVHRVLPTTRTTMLTALVRASLDRDQDAAGRALDEARRRSVPWDLARVELHLVDLGLADPALLLEAYDIFDEHRALLARAWTRTTMTARHVTIPARRTTVAENEELLAVLIGEGVTNRQAAAILRTSEKSVEGRLTRLFARTGHRSRLALANAARAGDLPPSYERG